MEKEELKNIKFSENTPFELMSTERKKANNAIMMSVEFVESMRIPIWGVAHPSLPMIQYYTITHTSFELYSFIYNIAASVGVVGSSW